MKQHDLAEVIAAAVARIEDRDPELAAELRRLHTRAGDGPAFEGLAANVADLDPEAAALAPEAVVLEKGRPVLTVVNGRPVLAFPDLESEVWRKRLLDAEALLGPAIAAVGRIEVEGLPDFSWVGTGVLVWDDVVATNQHVAHHFVERHEGNPVFRLNEGGDEMLPSIDFLEEEGRAGSHAFRIVEVLHLEDDKDPDIALLRVEPEPGRALPRPVELFSGPIARDRQIAAIGYPAFDSRTRNVELVEKLFGNVYDKKRLSPGQVIEARQDLVVHDCSVLNGNSGSALVDLETGHMVGLHFTGEFGKANYAVPAHVVREHLRSVGRFRNENSEYVERTSLRELASVGRGTVASVSIPIHLVVTIDGPSFGTNEASGMG